MVDVQTLIREAQDKANRLCRLAVEQTPFAYQSFITLIEQWKRVGGTRQAPIRAMIRLPYLSVDGRIKMARDEHRESSKRFDVHTEFTVEPHSQQLLARSTIASEIYGTVVAHARVFLDGDGPNATNPLEVAETSAVGRALGLLGGYGCYGTGLASAEEVLRTVERPESSPPPPTPATVAGQPDGSTSPTAPDGRSEDGRDTELTRLGQALQLRPGEVALRSEQAASDEEVLAQLRAEIVERLRQGATTRDTLPWYARGLGVPRAVYRTYLITRYKLPPGATPENELSDGQLEEERGRFVRRYEDPEIGVKFREQCARLGAPAAA
jgi:hypothetical protein